MSTGLGVIIWPFAKTILIEDGARPLLRKMIITQKHVTGAPQFTVVLSDWNVAAKLSDGLFIFTVPKNAKKIEFLPMESTRYFKH